MNLPLEQPGLSAFLKGAENVSQMLLENISPDTHHACKYLTHLFSWKTMGCSFPSRVQGLVFLKITLLAST